MCTTFSRELERLLFSRKNDPIHIDYTISTDDFNDNYKGEKSTTHLHLDKTKVHTFNRTKTINDKESDVTASSDFNFSLLTFNSQSRENLKKEDSINNFENVLNEEASINVNSQLNFDISNLTSIYRKQKLKQIQIDMKNGTFNTFKNRNFSAERTVLNKSSLSGRFESNTTTNLRVQTAFDLYTSKVKRFNRSNSAIQKGERSSYEETATEQSTEKLRPSLVREFSLTTIKNIVSEEPPMPNLKSFQVKMDNYFKNRIKENLKHSRKQQTSRSNNNFNSPSSNFRSQSYEILLKKHKITTCFPITDLVIKNSLDRRDLQKNLNVNLNYNNFTNSRKIKSAASYSSSINSNHKIINKRFIINKAIHLRNKSSTALYNRMYITGKNLTLPEKTKK
jgi:hypothetical protein